MHQSLQKEEEEKAVCVQQVVMSNSFHKTMSTRLLALVKFTDITLKAFDCFDSTQCLHR